MLKRFGTQKTGTQRPMETYQLERESLQQHTLEDRKGRGRVRSQTGWGSRWMADTGSIIRETGRGLVALVPSAMVEEMTALREESFKEVVDRVSRMMVEEVRLGKVVLMVEGVPPERAARVRFLKDLVQWLEALVQVVAHFHLGQMREARSM